VQAAIQSFMRRCDARNLSHHTKEFYRFRFEAFARFLLAHAPTLGIADVTPAVIRDFLADETTRISSLTAHHSFITLRCFFRYLTAEGLIDTNPMEHVEPLRQRKKVITTFTTDQVRALLAACGTDFTGKRDSAIILILADCGLRVSELCGLTLDAIDWRDRTLLVLGKGAKERRVPFGNAAYRALTAYTAHRGEIPKVNSLFVSCYGVPLTRLRILEMLKDRGTATGVDISVCSPHNFRRYFAVSYLRNGGDVFSLQKLLGHTSLEMTRRYAELAQTDIVEKHRRFSPGDMLQLQPTSGRKRYK